MDVSVLERLVAEVEGRVRALLLQTASDDSHAVQVELREAAETLGILRDRLSGAMGEDALPGF